MNTTKEQVLEQTEISHKLISVMDSDILNTLRSLNINRSEVVNELLEYMLFDINLIDKYAKENNDFWNDTNQEGCYWCDFIHEFANDKVSIYYNDLFANASILSEYTNQSIEDQGLESNEPIEQILAKGEYYFWELFAVDICSCLRKYVQESK